MLNSDDLKFAQKLQNETLPTPFEVKLAYPHSFVFYSPKITVSGDFYFFLKMDGKVIVCLGDCEGHDVTGILNCSSNSKLLKKIIETNFHQCPNDILNELFRQKNKNKEAVQIELNNNLRVSICKLDLNLKTLQFSGYKSSALLIRNNKFLDLRGNSKLILTTSEYNTFDNINFDLKKNDMIYLFSDGFINQFGGPNTKKLKRRNFYQLLLQISTLPLEDQKEYIQSLFEEWKGENEQTDDVCILGLKV